MEANLNNKNTCISFFEAIACIMIIFIHFPFPGTFGKVMDALARFGVPLFFVVSGFYLIKPGMSKEELRKKLVKRLLRIGIITLFSFILCFIYYSFQNKDNYSYFIKDTFGIKNWLLLIGHNIPFMSTPNWFLIAMLFSYGFIYIFAGLFIDNKYTSYIIASTLLFWVLIRFIFTATKVEVNGYVLCNINIYRSWFVNGLPFISLGISLNKQKELLKKIPPMVSIIMVLVSFILMAFEMILLKKIFNKGISYTLFDVICVISIITMSLHYPKLFSKCPFINQPGNWKLYVYIFHPIVISIAWGIIYKNHYDGLAKTSWLAPIQIMLVSVVTAITFNLIFYYSYNRLKQIIEKEKNISK